MTILLTGGSACGKSTYGETLASQLGGPLFYVAAMEPYGEESQRRIARHRAMRAEKGFVTLERYTDLSGLQLPEQGTVLLECLCNLSANEMFSPGGAGKAGAVQAILSGVMSLKNQSRHLIVVTNDVGAEYSRYPDPTTGEYVRVLGEINARLARDFDTVFELVCGIPLLLKGAWPCVF